MAENKHIPRRSRSLPSSEPIATTADHKSANGRPTDQEDVELDPNIVRLRTVLAMQAQGKNLKVIAAHFGRDSRTIRRWLKHARELGLAVSGDLLPEDAVSEVAQNFADHRADLLDLKREAEVEGHFGHRVWCIRELIKLEVAYVGAMERIGLFDGYRFVPPTPSDPTVESAEQLKQATRNLITFASENESED